MKRFMQWSSAGETEAALAIALRPPSNRVSAAGYQLANDIFVEAVHSILHLRLLPVVV